jgi:hypothetical protein
VRPVRHFRPPTRCGAFGYTVGLTILEECQAWLEAIRPNSTRLLCTKPTNEIWLFQRRRKAVCEKATYYLTQPHGRRSIVQPIAMQYASGGLAQLSLISPSRTSKSSVRLRYTAYYPIIRCRNERALCKRSEGRGVAQARGLNEAVTPDQSYVFRPSEYGVRQSARLRKRRRNRAPLHSELSADFGSGLNGYATTSSS